MRYQLACIFLFLNVLTSIAQDVSATQTLPANAAPGSDITVEVTVNKGSMSGFMKFAQEIPAGFTASDLDSKTGNFTFSDGAAKIIWMTPPADPSFTFSYKIAVPKDASGVKNLPAKISYIVNNERKIFEFEPKSILIGSASANAKTETKSPGTQPVATKTPEKKIEPVTPKTSEPVIVKSESKPEAPKEKAEQKSAGTNSNTQSTIGKVPVTAAPAAAGKSYRVQIGAFGSKPKVDGVPEISTVQLENGITKYFSGNFNNYDQAAKRKKEMIDKGFQGAFIVSFENGKIVK